MAGRVYPLSATPARRPSGAAEKEDGSSPRVVAVVSPGEMAEKDSQQCRASARPTSQASLASSSSAKAGASPTRGTTAASTVDRTANYCFLPPRLADYPGLVIRDAMASGPISPPVRPLYGVGSPDYSVSSSFFAGAESRPAPCLSEPPRSRHARVLACSPPLSSVGPGAACGRECPGQTALSFPGETDRPHPPIRLRRSCHFFFPDERRPNDQGSITRERPLAYQLPKPAGASKQNPKQQKNHPPKTSPPSRVLRFPIAPRHAQSLVPATNKLLVSFSLLSPPTIAVASIPPRRTRYLVSTKYLALAPQRSSGPSAAAARA